MTSLIKFKNQNIRIFYFRNESIITQNFHRKNCILEWDAKLVFEEFENGSIDYNGTLICEICVFGLSFVKFKVQYVPRDCDMVVGYLTHFAKFQMPEEWLGEV